MDIELFKEEIDNVIVNNCADSFLFYVQEHRDEFTPFEMAKMFSESFTKMVNDFAIDIYNECDL